ncbi:hypothetical protein [Streptomyces sp. NPDC020965]|uniref:hypothetical protein n=1 Tax=Streptomyces sp. NPDC020965 TaxID=3365105 RepID=UPI0037B13D15
MNRPGRGPDCGGIRARLRRAPSSGAGAAEVSRASALGRLGRTEEAEAEAQRDCRIERGRRWFRYNPNGAGAIASATKVADAARERTAQCLLAARLEQLHERAAVRTAQAGVRAVDGPAGLPKLAVHPLDGDTIGAVIA